MILDVDMEKNTWRKIDGPSGLQHSMHQAQDHLCVCTVGGPIDSKLSIWILEDYGTDNWILKHTVTMWILFGRINIRFGFLDFDDEDIVITVHLEWNLIFFAWVVGTIIAYDMDRISVCVSRVFRYGRRTVKKSSSVDHSIFLMFPCSWIH
jgi:hypothetical protein